MVVRVVGRLGGVLALLKRAGGHCTILRVDAGGAERRYTARMPVERERGGADERMLEEEKVTSGYYLCLAKGLGVRSGLFLLRGLERKPLYLHPTTSQTLRRPSSTQDGTNLKQLGSRSNHAHRCSPGQQQRQPL
jgi:hypothetical protein